MMRAATLEAYFADPEGCFVVSDGAIGFCAAPDLYGLVAWERHDASSVDKLCRILDAESRASTRVHDSLVDLRRLSGVDSDGFLRMKEYLTARSERQRVRRKVLIRPTGFAGALVAGFYDVYKPPYSTRVVSIAEEASAWLGRPEVIGLLEDLDAAIQQLVSGPTRAAVRALLQDDLELRLPQAAQRLGLSDRTLQRRLDEEGASFQEEARAARIERAKALLRDSDAKITAVARQVGCSSLQSFSALFRRITGQTPSQWRERARGSRPP